MGASIEKDPIQTADEEETTIADRYEPNNNYLLHMLLQ